MTLQADYDLWHQRIYDADPQHDDASSPWYQLVLQYLSDTSHSRVLEVACGRGGLLPYLVHSGARVTGCDFSFAALHAADCKLRQSQGPSPSHLVQGDAQSLPFADSSFDLVISCETIEHLPQVLDALQELHRVTRRNGKLFLTTPNHFNFMGLYELYARVRHPGRKDDQPFDRRQWFPQIHKLVRRAGWTILRTDGTVHQFPFFPGRNPVRWHNLESNRSLRKILSPFAYTYFVAAQKAVP